MEKIRIKIKSPQKGDLDVLVRKGIGLQAVAAKHKGYIDFDCRQADCGVCIVKVLEGMESLSERTFEEKDFLKAMQATEDERLACQCRVLGDVSLEVEF